MLFAKWGGTILNPETGRKVAFERKDGIYTMGMWVKPRKADASIFPRPGQ